MAHTFFRNGTVIVDLAQQKSGDICKFHLLGKIENVVDIHKRTVSIRGGDNSLIVGRGEGKHGSVVFKKS